MPVSNLRPDVESHANLFNARESGDPLTASLLAPFEHQAFAREWVKEDPKNLVSLLASIPAYQLYKLAFRPPNTTPASLDQMFAGYRGMMQGLK